MRLGIDAAWSSVTWKIQGKTHLGNEEDSCPYPHRDCRHLVPSKVRIFVDLNYPFYFILSPKRRLVDHPNN